MRSALRDARLHREQPGKVNPSPTPQTGSFVQHGSRGMVGLVEVSLRHAIRRGVGRSTSCNTFSVEAGDGISSLWYSPTAKT
jgi:hypothetical protein